MDTQPYWMQTAQGPQFPQLEEDLRADVVVIGGGITGLTAAYLLCKERRSVVVLEKWRIGGGETGHTTAHVTFATDTRLSELWKRFGKEDAFAVWDAGATAMEQIQAIVEEAKIDCDLRMVPALLVAAPGAEKDEADRLKSEADLASEMGFDAAFLGNAPLIGRPALKLANQLKFHPLKYLHGLAREIIRMGGQIYEQTEVSEFQDDPRVVTAGGHKIAHDYTVIATHVPLQGNRSTLAATLLQTKIAGYSTYAVEARMPANSLPEMLWWDTGDPYLYLRVDRRPDGDVVIIGGEDHKTGQISATSACFQRLEGRLRDILHAEPMIERHWSGQVIESVDGLPYIGEATAGQFIATGFSGNGMTFGTLAGIMARDSVIGSQNPWTDLFAVNRKTLSAAWDYAKENSDFPYYFAKDRLSRVQRIEIAEIPLGTGVITTVEGCKAAVYRDSEGKAHIHSATCPHLGCTVKWNEAEHTWDCPCHGSRFQATGEVFAGPAEKGLTPLKERRIERRKRLPA